MHQFVVFSVIEDDDTIKPKYAKCNNCGVIHRVTEVNRSDILNNKESMSSIITVDDLKSSMPPRLVELLEGNDADLPTWEAVKYIYDNKHWGEFAVLTTESDSGVRTGKFVRMLGENMFDVGGFEREEVAKSDE